MGDDLTTMGNFKGVMLCNRPPQIPGSLQTIVGPTSTSGPTRPAFVSAVVPDEQLGLPPVRHSRTSDFVVRRAAKQKNEDVTWRHKKWLGEFAERRAAIAQSMQQRVEEAAERRARFDARNQSMRDTIRGIKGSDSSREEKAVAIEAALSGRPAFLPTEYVDVSQQFPHGAPAPAPVPALAPQTQVWKRAEEEKESTAAGSDSAAAAGASTAAKPAQSKTGAAGSSSKPGWARTEAEDEELMDAEAESLVDFARDLDYQRYIDDLEVREALRFVAERVRGLEASKQTAEALAAKQAELIAAGELEEVWVVDESQPPDAEGKPALKRIVRRTKRAQKQALTLAHEGGEWDASTAASSQLDPETQSAREANDAARAMLESSRQLRNIHSSASVRAIMEKEKTAGVPSALPPGVPAGAAYASATTLRRSQLAAISESDAAAAPRPLITTIHEGDSKQKGVNPSNLPFLYRHPGI